MVRDALDHHRLAALEARFKADLEHHFVKQPFSEIIHSDFVAFDAPQEAGRLSQRWLDPAPRSAFALTARGTYFRRMAWKARRWHVGHMSLQVGSIHLRLPPDPPTA